MTPVRWRPARPARATSPGRFRRRGNDRPYLAAAATGGYGGDHPGTHPGVRPAVRTDDTLALWREGYPYVSARCDATGADDFRTRLLLRDTLCARGAEAAELFYEGHVFTRRGAMPTSVVHLLQDEGSVQALDGAAHRARKQLFLPLLEPEATGSFADELARAWRERLAATSPGERLELSRTMNQVLTVAALRWSGLRADRGEVAARYRELVAMVENAGRIGPPNWLARGVRLRSERWAADTVAAIRRGRATPPPDSMAARVAAFTEGGRLLPCRIAGIELLNVLRPIVAISRFVVFAALALWRHPPWQERFSSGDTERVHAFADEVRRTYPFFPLIAGRALRPFDRGGRTFPPGMRMVLDLYGTNHDPRVWRHPDAFRPERFDGWTPSAYELVPQGAGAYESGHRCPGERLTTEAVARMAVELSRTGYRVPAQDTSVSLSRMPALPRSGFIVQV